jgi:hypothetical protein
VARTGARPMTKQKRGTDIDPAILREIIDLQHRARETDKKIEETLKLLQEARRRLRERSRVRV